MTPLLDRFGVAASSPDTQSDASMEWHTVLFLAEARIRPHVPILADRLRALRSEHSSVVPVARDLILRAALAISGLQEQFGNLPHGWTPAQREAWEAATDAYSDLIRAGEGR